LPAFGDEDGLGDLPHGLFLVHCPSLNLSERCRLGQPPGLHEGFLGLVNERLVLDGFIQFFHVGLEK